VIQTALRRWITLKAERIGHFTLSPYLLFITTKAEQHVTIGFEKNNKMSKSIFTIPLCGYTCSHNSFWA
jgi:hypothetical protein